MTITVGSDTAKTRRSLKVGGTDLCLLLDRRGRGGGARAFQSRLPAALKVVLENMLRFEDGKTVTVDDIKAFSLWAANGGGTRARSPTAPRVLMQDFTGVPAVVDLAAMRDAMVALGGDPQKINPLNPVDLVIDHSVMVDEFGNPRAFQLNVDREYERNGERYEFLKWGQGAFDNFRVVPPGTGICHQVNLEYLGQTVWTDKDQSGARSPIPTRWSAPTATPPWSTASPSSAGASAGSRPRPRCSASRSRC
jgi:aconitate hydratase